MNKLEAIDSGTVQKGDYYQVDIEELPGNWKPVPPAWYGKQIVDNQIVDNQILIDDMLVTIRRAVNE